jgi:hypothetical protein
MICEQCEYNPAEEDSFLCEDCLDKNTPIAEGDLPGYKIPDYGIPEAASCSCDDEMCTSCRTFQEMSAAHHSVLAL